MLGDYIGLPYERFNCWALAALVMREHFGMLPPHIDFRGDPKKADAYFIKHLADWEPVTDPLPGNLVVFNIQGKPLHCGLVVRPGIMIHTLQGHNSVTERFRNNPKWAQRIRGFYRWPN